MTFTSSHMLQHTWWCCWKRHGFFPGFTNLASGQSLGELGGGEGGLCWVPEVVPLLLQMEAGGILDKTVQP